MRFLSLICVTLLGCASLTAKSQSGNYPAEWFAPVPKEGAPSWEILPQDAGPGEVILSKRNELGILSNFAATPFKFEGVHYASVEGFWQMMLFPEGPTDPRALAKDVVWPATRREVSQMVGFEAKRAGEKGKENMKKMGIDWVTYKGTRMTYKSLQPDLHYKLIRQAMWEKLQQNPSVKDVLLKTGDLKLRPDHVQDPASPPEWRYYEIWMEYRDLIRDGKAPDFGA